MYAAVNILILSWPKRIIQHLLFMQMFINLKGQNHLIFLQRIPHYRNSVLMLMKRVYIFFVFSQNYLLMVNMILLYQLPLLCHFPLPAIKQEPEVFGARTAMVANEIMKALTFLLLKKHL